MSKVKIYFEAIHELIVAGHLITEGVSKCLKNYEITEPQYNVLRVLSEAGEGPVAVQEIQKKMVQRSSNVTRIIDKLLLKSYVIRTECPTNRRKMDISLTEEGRQFLKILDKKVFYLHKSKMKNLTAEELTVLQKLISKLNITNDE